MKPGKTRILQLLYLIFFSLFLFLKCKNAGQKTIDECNCEVIELKYAKYFKIYKCADKVVLYVTKLKKNSTENIQKKYNIKYRVKSIGITSTSYVGYLEKLDELDKISFVDNISLYYNDYILQSFKKGKIKEIGYSPNLNVEVLLSRKPDVIFTYTLNEKDLSYYELLRNKGVEVVIISEFLEEHPLGRAEWIKFFAAFFNKLDTAEKIFNKIEQTYLEVAKKSVLGFKKYKPKVLLEAPFNGIWYMPGGKTITAKLIEDAGGDYILKNDTNKEVYILNPEQIFSLCALADVWLNAGSFTSKKQLLSLDPQIEHFKSYKQSKIYSPIKKICNKGNEYFEQAPVNPHILLLDFYNIFTNNDSNLYYYVKLK